MIMNNNKQNTIYNKWTNKEIILTGLNMNVQHTHAVNGFLEQQSPSCICKT